MNEQITKEQLQKLFTLDWAQYKTALADVEKQREEVSYNIVSVSTYTGHLENYHSDVWGFLLDGKAAHRKGNEFLSCFIDYLIKLDIVQRLYSDPLKNAEVHREKGRIDVLIVNKKQKVCIIIENKINDAPDMDNQLERYKRIAKKAGWKIAAMLYISLTGERLSTLEDADLRVYPIAACNDSPNSLLKGWLIPAKEAIPLNNQKTDENIRSFLHQYCMLLQNLKSQTMHNQSHETIYDLVNLKDNFDTALLIEQGLENVKFHRAELFAKAVEAQFKSQSYFMPAFTKKPFYPDYINHMVFQGFKYDLSSYQLDIIHYKDRTRFAFYKTRASAEVDDIKNLLTQIIGLHDFGLHGFASQIGKTMHISDGYPSLMELDKAVAGYAIELFTKFNEFANK
jgi:hypothetical protein